MVLDNASAHSDKELTKTTERLRIDFLFLPAYTPELNSIECLWSVIKKDFKQRLATVKFDKLAQTEFSQLLQKSLNSVTLKMQADAARNNNREFLERIWSQELAAQLPRLEESK